MISDISKIGPVGADSIRPQDMGERDGRMISAPTRDNPRTPEMIGAEIRLLTAQARRVLLDYAIQIGYRLKIAHEKVGPHGWAEWLKKETEFSAASASRFESLYEGYGEEQGSLFGVKNKFPTLKNLSISNALRLLAIPEEERESFALEHDAENLSARDLEALVKERTASIEAELKSTTEDAKEIEYRRRQAEYRLEEREKDLEKEKTARAEAEEQLQRIKRELEEIENRPQAVAYERDELAIAEAVQAERERLEREQAGAIAKAANDAADVERAKRSAAEKDYKKSIKELKDQIKKAEEEKAETGKRLEELTRKAAEAEKSGRENEGLQRQIETLKKQLALAAPSVAAFKAAFDRAQDELVHMELALRAIQDEEIKEKLKKASLAMLDGVMERVKG